MEQAVRHPVEIYIYIDASVGHDGGALRSQLGFLAVTHRDADVHEHRAQVRHQGRWFAVRAALSRHVFVTTAGFLHCRFSEQAKNDHDDRVPENMEFHSHVGRHCRYGHAGIPRRHHHGSGAVRIHRGHWVFVERRVQHKPLGPIAELCRTLDGYHQHGCGVRRYCRPPVRRVVYQRSSKKNRHFSVPTLYIVPI